MVAAASQAAVTLRATIPAETNLVTDRKTVRSRRVGATAGVKVCPIRHPFLHVAHHVEYAPARLAARPRARVHGAAGRDIAVRRPVVRARVRRAGRRTLPFLVRRQPLAREGARLLGLEPLDAGA